MQLPRDAVPRVYDALKVDGTAITLEVQQQLGDGVVRAIALGSTDGLKRGLVAENTHRAIAVPVGTATLGRIMDVLGNPIDEVGPIAAADMVRRQEFADGFESVADGTVGRAGVDRPLDESGVGQFAAHRHAAPRGRRGARAAGRRCRALT